MCQDDNINDDEMINNEGSNDLYEVAMLEKHVEEESATSLNISYYQ